MTIDLNDRVNKTWLHPTGEPVQRKLKKENKKSNNFVIHSHDENVELREDFVKASNALSDETNNLITQQQGALQNSIQNLEGEMVSSMLEKVLKTKNKFDDQDEVMSESEKKKFINDLKLIISTYYISLFPIYANQLIRKRATEFNVQVPFDMDKEVKNYIQVTARRAAQSHVNTIVDDILKTTKKAYEESFSDIQETLKASGEYDDAEAYKLAREKALEGASQQRIINDIKKKYQDIAQTRARTIARTETNRAFTQSQFQADVQFLNTSGLMNRAYKKWETRSDNPCAYCIDLADRGPIPFENNFQDLGTEISSIFYQKDGTPVVRKLQINYEELSAGNAHVNCSCRYVLVIRGDNDEFLNNFNLDVDKNAGNPHHDEEGKFTFGPGGFRNYSKMIIDGRYDDFNEYMEEEFSSDNKTNQGSILSDDEFGEMSNYVGTDQSFEMNEAIRNGELSLHPDYSRTLNVINNISKKYTLKHDTQLFRAVLMKDKINVDTVLNNPALSSTSFSISRPRDLLELADGNDDNLIPHMIKINAKKGTHGVPVDYVYSDRNVKQTEYEFILPSNTSLRIDKSFKTRDPRGNTFIMVEASIK